MRHLPEGNRRTVRDLRRVNRSVLLRQLYFRGPLSRQELGPVTGLSAASVSNVTSQLLADGLLEEAGSVHSEGGRPRTLLRVAPRAGTLVGVDVGETRVRVELFDVALSERARAEYPLRDGGRDVGQVVKLVAEGLATVCDTARGTAPQPSDGELLGIGVGVPGIVEQDPARGGAVVHAQTVGWDAVPLESLLRASAAIPDGIPVLVSNGARTLGQAESWFGAGQGARDAVVVLIGSGVGAAVVTDGSAYGAASRGTGEWGHTTIALGGRRCRCGARGCLEAYVGAGGVLGRWREAQGAGGAGGGAGGGDAGIAGDAGDEEAALGELLARQGSEPADTVLRETAEYLGAGIADLVNLFNPERIVVAGWAGLLLGPRLLPAVREATTAHALRHPATRTALELGDLGPDAVTVGAATLPLARFLADGGRGTRGSSSATG